MTQLDEIIARIKVAPPVVGGSLTLSLVYLLIVLGVILLPRHFNWILQYLGGEVIPLATAAVACCSMAIFGNQRALLSRFSVVLMALAAFGGFGIYQHHWGSLRDANRFGNPYLNYSEWQPLFTIGLPLLWAAVLQSPQVKQWIRDRVAPPL